LKRLNSPPKRQPHERAIIEPFVARLRVFPFKSLDGADVKTSALVTRGGLRSDRAFALFDENGGVVNAKREPRVHELRVGYDTDVTCATFVSPRIAAPHVFALDDDSQALASWLSTHFERSVTVRRDLDGGFPDDMKAPGPTLVSSATLAAVATWFPGLSADDVRLRLRANIEIDGVPAFWEDGLFTTAGEVVPFRIGSTVLEGTNPCARCIVPSRDALTGLAMPTFAKVVSQQRAATLPRWVERSRFDHFYRLTVNTQAGTGQCGSAIAVGDALERLAVTMR
jgi:uncharacterized protein YcbX